MNFTHSNFKRGGNLSILSGWIFASYWVILRITVTIELLGLFKNHLLVLPGELLYLILIS